MLATSKVKEQSAVMLFEYWFKQGKQKQMYALEYRAFQSATT